MGISGAIVTSGNTIDLALAELRELYRKRERRQGRRQSAIDARPSPTRRPTSARW